MATIRKTSHSSSSGRRLNTGIGMNFGGFHSVSLNIPSFNAPLLKSCSQAHKDTCTVAQGFFSVDSAC